MKCPQCNSGRLRNSRFRVPDLIRLLLLHYPIRCRDCKMRRHVWIFQALKLRLQNERLQKRFN